jgi:glycine/D-amino acid oxidase-like deaminating enzyme
MWQDFCQRSGKPLLQRTGVLWLVLAGDEYTSDSLKTLQRAGLAPERLSVEELHNRYPQFNLDGVSWGLLEPSSGVILARQAVQALVEDQIQAGTRYVQEAVLPPRGARRLVSMTTTGGNVINAGTFVFACGPWLPALFPELLGNRFFITRQEVFFFGVPAGSNQYAPPAMPVWLCLAHQVYGIPALTGRGFKIAFDRHGPEFDPENGGRIITSDGLHETREYLGKRFPALKDAPVLETRVCQYENTSSGDFLIDHHPDFDNVWLVGGGSGHGFKHGPVVGECAANLVVGRTAVEPRFSLNNKLPFQNRMVF